MWDFSEFKALHRNLAKYFLSPHLWLWVVYK
jgi:hypothetical protein